MKTNLNDYIESPHYNTPVCDALGKEFAAHLASKRKGKCVGMQITIKEAKRVIRELIEEVPTLKREDLCRAFVEPLYATGLQLHGAGLGLQLSDNTTKEDALLQLMEN